MDKALGTVLAPIPSSRKVAARAALVDLKENSRSVLSDCFRQFGIETVPMTGDMVERLKTEKFEACVLRLVPGAEVVMDAARTSPSNSRMVIYGLGGSVQDAMKFSKYGVNAVFNEPLERPAALKLVRATQMLVLHEFRRYVRIPVITEVSVTTGDNRKFTATSHELSSGGMSMKAHDEVSSGQMVEVSFALLTLPRIWVRGNVTWKKPASKTFGIRFDPHDERRQRIKEWIDAYLEN
ncbi:MAG TPA: PilZ domain-containing protein [Terriglobales bacterium]|nr:PilZ domain-containing protein [Terriglobales bacterium]